MHFSFIINRFGGNRINLKFFLSARQQAVQRYVKRINARNKTLREVFKIISCNRQNHLYKQQT